MTESTPIRIAQVVGLTGTAALAGVVFSFSGLVVPRILESPAPLLLTQWRHAFEVGKTRVPPLAGVCASSFLYLAYEAHKNHASNVVPHKWKMYALSALLTLGIAPYTALVMLPINRKLESKEEETRGLAASDTIVKVGLGETAHALVDKWATMNIGRAALLSLAAILAAWAAQK